MNASANDKDKDIDGLGDKVVAEVVAREFGEENVERRPGGYRCHRLGLTQEIWADPPVDSRGVTSWRVQVRTTALRGFDGSSLQLRALSFGVSQSPVSSVVRSHENPTKLQLASTFHVNAGNLLWAPRLLAFVIQRQLIEASQLGRASVFLDTGIEIDDNGIASPWVGAPISDMHAIEPDELFDADVTQVAEIAQTLATLHDVWYLHTVKTPRGVTARIPAQDPTAGDEDILIEIEVKSHSRLGLGLALTLSVPGWADMSDALGFAESEVEMSCRNDLLGSWSVEANMLMHRSFYPLFVASRAVALHVATAAVRRALWLDLGPGSVPPRRRLRRFPPNY